MPFFPLPPDPYTSNMYYMFPLLRVIYFQSIALLTTIRSSWSSTHHIAWSRTWPLEQLSPADAIMEVSTSFPIINFLNSNLPRHRRFSLNVPTPSLGTIDWSILNFVYLKTLLRTLIFPPLIFPKTMFVMHVLSRSPTDFLLDALKGSQPSPLS